MKIKTKIFTKTTHNLQIEGGTYNEVILNSKRMFNDSLSIYLSSSIIDEQILNKQAIIGELIKTIDLLLKTKELPKINLKGFKWDIINSYKISFIRNKTEIIDIGNLPFKHYDNVIKMLTKYIELMIDKNGVVSLIEVRDGYKLDELINYRSIN